MKKIVLTGGGTAGHVTPNIALMPELKKRGYDISYIGSYEGMEKGMIMETKTPYYGIATGKLRRYFDLKNWQIYCLNIMCVIKNSGSLDKIIFPMTPNLR